VKICVIPEAFRPVGLLKATFLNCVKEEKFDEWSGGLRRYPLRQALEALTCTDVQNALAVLDESPAIEFKETFGNEKELRREFWGA